MSVEQSPIMEFAMTLPITNFSHIILNAPMFTETVNQCNVPWKITFVKMVSHCSVYVHCEKTRGNVDWSIKTRIRISMNSIYGNCAFKEFNATFGSEFPVCAGHGLYDYITIDELHHNLIFSDQVILEVRIEILEMTGIETPPILRSFDDNEAKDMSDVALLVEDQRFFVSKFTLAQQSTYFKTLFFGGFKESEQSEITLKDIDSATFQVYLEVLHMETPLTDSCVEEVLELSQMYDSKNVTRICEDFLLQKSKLSTKKKLQMACQFDLKELKKSCLGSLKSLADVRACMDCGGLKNGIKDPEMLSSLHNIYQEIEKRIIALHHAHVFPRVLIRY